MSDQTAESYSKWARECQEMFRSIREGTPEDVAVAKTGKVLSGILNDVASVSKVSRECKEASCSLKATELNSTLIALFPTEALRQKVKETLDVFGDGLTDECKRTLIARLVDEPLSDIEAEALMEHFYINAVISRQMALDSAATH